MNKTGEDNNDPEYGLDSRYASEDQSASEAIQLMEARLKKMRNLTDGDIAAASLLQLHLQMEEYLAAPTCGKESFFLSFLKRYIDILYHKKSSFAADIDITSSRLSQIINKHREPTREFFQRLMIHSERAFKDICDFNTSIWYEIYYQENLCLMLADQDQWRPEVEELITVNEPASPGYKKKR